MNMSPRFTRPPLPGERSNAGPHQDDDELEQWRVRADRGSDDDRPDMRDVLAPKAARTTIFVIGGALVAAVALTLIALLVNSIMDYKLTTGEQPRVAEKAAPSPSAAEPERAQPSQQDVVAAQKKLGDELSKLTLQAPGQSAPAPAQPQAAPPPSAQPPQATISADDVSKMLMRASSLVREGQVASARSLLELASRSNDPSVAFALAETYDPKTLARWRAIGISGDIERARTLYKQALDGGVTEARDRLSELDR